MFKEGAGVHVLIQHGMDLRVSEVLPCFRDQNLHLHWRPFVMPGQYSHSTGFQALIRGKKRPSSDLFLLCKDPLAV
jgi:hypothetical protein